MSLMRKTLAQEIRAAHVECDRALGLPNQKGLREPRPPPTWKHQHCKTPDSEGQKKVVVKEPRVLHRGAGGLQSLLRAKREEEARRRNGVETVAHRPTLLEVEKEKEWAFREEVLAMTRQTQVRPPPSASQTLLAARARSPMISRDELYGGPRISKQQSSGRERSAGCLGRETDRGNLSWDFSDLSEEASARRRLEQDHCIEFQHGGGGGGGGGEQRRSSSMAEQREQRQSGHSGGSLDASSRLAAAQVPSLGGSDRRPSPIIKSPVSSAASASGRPVRARKQQQVQISPESSMATIPAFFRGGDDEGSFASDDYYPHTIDPYIVPTVYDDSGGTSEPGSRAGGGGAGGGGGGVWAESGNASMGSFSDADPQLRLPRGTPAFGHDARPPMAPQQGVPPPGALGRPPSQLESGQGSERQPAAPIAHGAQSGHVGGASLGRPGTHSGGGGRRSAPAIASRASGPARSDAAIKHALTVALGRAQAHLVHQPPKGPKRDPIASPVFQLQMNQADERAELKALIPLMKGAKRPPYSIESPYEKGEFDDEEYMKEPFTVNPGTAELGHRDPKEKQFAWWSKHWNAKINKYEKPPIKPVERIWLGNFQRAPVPWRKEQLGSFPAYRDFAWPPPEDSEHVQERMHQYFQDLTPFAEDRVRFVGPNDKPINQIMRDAKLLPDFLDRTGDRSGITTILPGGKCYRPNGVVGWAGYKQMHPGDQYDVMTKRAYSKEVDRLIGIVSDKLTEHSVSNFYLAFTGFDTDKSGKIDLEELKAFLNTWNIILRPEEISDLFNAFIDPNRELLPGETPQIDYTDFVEAIDKSQSTHPLDPLGKERQFKPLKPASKQNTRSSQGSGTVSPESSGLSLPPRAVTPTRRIMLPY